MIESEFVISRPFTASIPVSTILPLFAVYPAVAIFWCVGFGIVWANNVYAKKTEPRINIEDFMRVPFLSARL